MLKKIDQLFFSVLLFGTLLAGLGFVGVWYSKLPVAYSDGITGKTVYFEYKGMLIFPGDPLFNKLSAGCYEQPTPVQHGYKPSRLHIGNKTDPK